MPARETEVLVSLGSNIEPAANLARAVERLARLLRLEAVSAAWESEPFGAPGTPRFLNAAARGRTELPAAELRRELRRIESGLGRRRTADRNAPRTIDLDIACYGDPETAAAAEGGWPDPEIGRRAYLALPLAELAPELRLAGGETLAAAAKRLAAADPAPPRRAPFSLSFSDSVRDHS